MVKKIVVSLLILALMCTMLVSCDLASLGLDVNVSDINNFIDNNINPDAEDETEDNFFAELEGKTPFEVYSQFSEKLTSAEDNCTIRTVNRTNTKMNILGQSITADTYLDMIVMNYGDNFYIMTKAVNSSTEASASFDSISEIWYVDGILYMVYDGNKIQLEASKEQVNELVYGDLDMSGSDIIDIPESWFEGVTFESHDDGSYTMNIDMSGERVKEAVARLGIADMDGLDVSEVKYQYTVDANGMIKESNATYSMSMSDSADSDKYSATASGQMSAIYSDIGTTAPIVAPDDAADYIIVTYEEIFG